MDINEALYTMTPDEIIKNAKFYVGVPENRGNNGYIDCYLFEIPNGFDGCRLELKYCCGVGYYWDIVQFREGYGCFDTSRSTKAILTAMKDAGLHKCPQCGSKRLYELYGQKLHDVNECMPVSDRVSHFLYRHKESVRVAFFRARVTVRDIFGAITNRVRRTKDFKPTN